MTERIAGSPEDIIAHIFTQIAGYCSLNGLLKSGQYIKIAHNVDVQGKWEVVFTEASCHDMKWVLSDRSRMRGVPHSLWESEMEGWDGPRRKN